VKIIDRVTGVWPGVATKVTAASPTLMDWPSAPAMSLRGLPPGMSADLPWHPSRNRQ
jgi:hypothetical protein